MKHFILTDYYCKELAGLHISYLVTDELYRQLRDDNPDPNGYSLSDGWLVCYSDGTLTGEYVPYSGDEVGPRGFIRWDAENGYAVACDQEDGYAVLDPDDWVFEEGRQRHYDWAVNLTIA